jgi:hypothetical protein
MEQYTSRSSNPLRTSLAIDHGIGRVVVTFKALRMWKTSVNNISTPAWRATLKRILRRLTPMIWYHSGLFRLRLRPRVGKPSVPCVLSPTLRLGIIESKRRKNSEGTRKNSRRIPKVPTTSTLSGGWERTFLSQGHHWCETLRRHTRVLQVCNGLALFILCVS